VKSIIDYGEENFFSNARIIVNQGQLQIANNGTKKCAQYKKPVHIVHNIVIDKVKKEGPQYLDSKLAKIVKLHFEPEHNSYDFLYHTIMKDRVC
jgi:hypothetical protein